MENKKLENFVQKMYEMQYSQKDKNLSNQELKEIALDTGMSENDWEESRQQLKASEQNGKQHLSAQNYESAIKEFKQAIMLNPYKVENVYNIALAHYQKYESTNDIFALGKSQEFADSCLQIQAGYTPAIQLLSTIKKSANKKKKKTSKNKKYIIFGTIAGLILLTIIVVGKYVSINNTVVEKEELVKSKWAQVENVYQRRADLIPQLVTTVKAASEFEKETLDMLVQARANATAVHIDPAELSADEIANFQAKQDELSQALARFIMISEDYPELKSLENFRDLQSQIEGSENRISVERRRFNEEVKEYNTYVKKFPQKLFGYKEKGYFQVNKNAQEVPDIDL